MTYRRSNPLTDPQNPNPITLSVRLGWLAVEAFGRLRRWARSGRKPDFTNRDPTRRFTFSDREPVLYEQLLISLRQLQEVGRQLLPDLPPPIPEDVEILLQAALQNPSAGWGEFESWSRVVWNTLQVQNPLAGQAFSTGGSLADTYWYAQGAGPDRLKELLRPHRLEGIAERIDALGDFLPEYTAGAIHNSLYRWRGAGEIDGLDEPRKKRLLDQLESQAQIWRNLLFGQQRAEDYLTAEDRRAVSRSALIATLLLALLAALFAWLAVLLLSELGRVLLAANPDIIGAPTGSGGTVAIELLDWQNWATLLATLSSVVVVLSGFITRLSGWMISYYRWSVARLTLERIYRRTFTDREPPAASGPDDDPANRL